MFKWFRPNNKRLQYDMTRSELITVYKPKMPISKQYRISRTNLELMAFDDGLGTIEQVVEMVRVQHMKG